MLHILVYRNTSVNNTNNYRQNNDIPTITKVKSLFQPSIPQNRHIKGRKQPSIPSLCTTAAAPRCSGGGGRGRLGLADVLVVARGLLGHVLGRAGRGRLGPVLVLQGLRGRDALGGVVLQEPVHEVEACGAERGLAAAEGLRGEEVAQLVQRAQLEPELLRAGELRVPRPALLVGGAQDLKDLGELFHLPLSRKERLTGDELRKDAPDAPHVDRGGVLAGAQEQLGRPVPQRHHHVGVGADGALVLAGQAEVADGDLARVAVEQVRGLQVPVDVPAAVHVLHAAQDLQQQPLDLGRGEGLAHLVHEGLQVVVHVLHHHVHLVHAAAHHHLLHLHDVRVLEAEQHVRLAQGRDGEALLRRVPAHLHLLERDDLPRAAVACAEHDAVGALVDAAQALVVLHRPAPVVQRVVAVHPRAPLAVVVVVLPREGPVVRLEAVFLLAPPLLLHVFFVLFFLSLFLFLLFFFLAGLLLLLLLLLLFGG
mmetsp:Transcript_6969/g.11900  ORF Transcript_6969/g.11900 Transcript_6969/m.11900 type:complete len:480 (+) Transcript_6969:118-1557(+)